MALVYDAFELWCLQTDQNEYLLEGLMLKQKLHYSGPPDVKSRLSGKALKLWKIEGRRRSGRQDEMAGWHHRFNGYKPGQILEDGEAQGNLAWCPPGMGVTKNGTQLSD